ncbi:MAG: hypothetical protein HIU92_05440 [Proteobacteria bacterium]|nr:hypothetical protein [Pseudomonadota bacterium]
MATPVHDWVVPKLDALLGEAMQNGMDREVVVAVITDIITGPGYNDAVVREEDAPQPTGLTDPAQEPIPSNTLPVSRPEWFVYAPSALPDPQE